MHEQTSSAARSSRSRWRAGSLRAQSFPPGYVDPLPLLAAASKEIGEANLRCITFSGTGYDGAVGQTAEYAVNIDWPRIDALSNYTRTINWETGTSKETFDRKPGLNPASWKYGLGWRGGTPIQKQTRQTHIVNGAHAWYIDGEGGEPVAVSPEDAERYQLDLWLNPPGFLKAARLPGANPKAIWRWEQIEMGRDGNVVAPEKMHVVSITMLGKYRVEATINPQNQIQRIKTTVSEPAIGDFNIEQESTEQMTFGNVKWPIVWHSHQGWDDNWQFDNASTGHNAYGGKFPKVQPNVCDDPVPVPNAIRQRQAGAGATVTVEKMAAGVYRLGGSTHNSYMVEFRDFVAVFEAPLQRGAQPCGDRGDREAGAGQADPVADQLASAFRSHRRPADLPAHRLDDRRASEGDRLPQPRRAELPAAHDQSRHRRAVAADRVVGGLQLRGDQRELRDHRQQPHPARLLRAAARARGRHVDGVPAGGADRVRGGSVRHARAAAGDADAGDAQLLQPGAAHEARHRDDRAGARTGRCRGARSKKRWAWRAA